MSAWSEELRGKLRETVSRRGVRFVADAIPADRNTVYRLVKGETLKPTRAVQAAVERIVEQEQKVEQ